MSSPSGCPVGCLLLFVHIRRVRWCCCPLSSLLIACSRLSMLDVLSVCPVGCLLLLLVRPHSSCPSVLLPAQLSTDRLLSLANAGRPLCLSCRLRAAVACSSKSAAWLSSDSLLSLAIAGCPLSLAVLSAACYCCLFVYIRRVRWCCCPPGSLLIACSRLPTLDVLSVWLSCRLLAAVACLSTSAAWLSTDRLVLLAKAGCPLRLAVLSAACFCCLFVHIRRVHWF